MAYNPAHIARTIERLADEAGSKRKLAAKAGLDDKTIGNIIRRHSGLTIETAYKIAQAGGISIIDLLGEPHEAPLDQEAQQLIRRLFDLTERAARATENLPVEDCPKDARQSA